MRKGWLLGIILVLILFFLATPYLLGGLAQQRVIALTDFLSDHPNITVTIEDYQRSWFSSSAQFSLQFKPPIIMDDVASTMDTTLLPGQMSFLVDETIRHGPIMFQENRIWVGRALMHLEFFTLDNTVSTTQHATAQPMLTSDILIKLNNSVWAQLVIPAMEMENEDTQTRYTWEGLNANWLLTANARQRETTIDVNALNLMAPDVTLAFDNIHFASQITEDTRGNWDSNNTLSIPHLQMESKVNTIDMDNLTLKTKTSTVNGLLSNKLKVQLAKLVIDEQTYGPVNYASKATKIDAAALAQLQYKFSLLEFSEQLNFWENWLLLPLTTELTELISQGAQFDLQTFEFTVPEGEVSLSGMLTFPDYTDQSMIPLFTFILDDVYLSLHVTFPKLWIKRVLTDIYVKHYQQQQALYNILLHYWSETDDMDGEESLTEKALRKRAGEDAQTQIKQLTNEGLLTTADEDYYTVEIEWEKGRLNINDQAVLH